MPHDGGHHGAHDAEPVGRGLTRRRFLRGAAALAVTGSMAGATYIVGMEPHWVEVVHRDLPVPDLDPAMQGRTLALISDLHVGPYVEDAYLRRAVQQTAALEPDLVAITGDLVTYRNESEVERVCDILSELGQPPLGIYATLGNHDYGPYRRDHGLAADLTRYLGEQGVAVLRNEYLDAGGLRIAGLDDLWSGRFQPERVMAAMRGGRSSIVLCHNPDSADADGWRDYAGWILCGHTHGGQVQLPGAAAPILPVKNLDYVSGEVGLEDGRHMYINRGLGYMYRLRLNARPEITLLRLTGV